MALYLTSDEIFDQQNDLQFNEFNSRTNFSNLISKDYFKHPEFNIALKEIYFDPRFPSLADLDCPHVITIVTPTENIEIEDFPTKIQELPLFKEMFQKNEWDKEYGQFSGPSVSVNSSTDYQIFIDIDSRFGYAYSISVLRDISFESNIEAVKFLNEYMFPFHKEKPISIDNNGKVSFDSNLDVFMSDNILKLLGFTQHINEYETVIPFAHFPSFFLDEHPYLAPDLKGRVKDRANLFRKYMSSNPKAEIVIEYNLDAVFTNESTKSDSIINVQFDLELFTINEKIAFEYSKIIRKINNILRERFIDNIKMYVVNKILKEMGALEDPRIAQEDIDEIIYENGQLVETIISNFLQYLSSIKKENADEFQDDMDDWGGLITLSAKNKKIMITKFHTEARKQLISTDGLSNEHSRMIFEKLFILPTVKKVTMNLPLCNLFSLNHNESGIAEIHFDASGKYKAQNNMEYFKTARFSIAKNYEFEQKTPANLSGNKIPYFLHIPILRDVINQQSENQAIPVIGFRTENENVMFLKGNQIYTGDSPVNINANHPKLIYVTCNFIQHSSYCSKQKQILNYFPIDFKDTNIIHHRFKNPIKHEGIAESRFHIRLLDENFQTLKASKGVPTLIFLDKTESKQMFSVILSSSDIENFNLYPKNSSNNFVNKLSIPLYFPSTEKWSVSIRSISYPKVKNIYPNNCKITILLHNGSTKVIKIPRPVYISTTHSFVSLINEMLATELSLNPPQFEMGTDGILTFKSNDHHCQFEGDMLHLLGLSYAFVDHRIKILPNNEMKGYTHPQIDAFQPQEIIVTSNIAEESFYARSRPNILRIVPIIDQHKTQGYNYIQFNEYDDVKVKLDQINEIAVKILTRKGELVDFDEQMDVKVQLEFIKKI
jgi:hypothetical protein